MKLKNGILLLMIILLAVSCVNTVIAATADDYAMELNQDDGDIALSEDNELSISDSNTLSLPKDESSLKESTNQNIVAEEDSQKNVLTPYEKFCEDLESNQGTVYLTGDIKVSEPFIIRHAVVIDGQGHTIDGQHKTNMFKAYSKLTLKNIKFVNGKAAQGGAVYSYTGNLIIDKCTFTGNVATENGGAIYISTASLTVTNSQFTKNKVENSKKTGHGGAIWIYKGSSKISKCTFKSNTCLSTALKKHSQATKYQFGGGAVYYNEGSTHALSECTFTGNKASNHGGAVYAHKPKTVNINKCTFNGNKVTFEDGGAITFNGGKLVLTNSKFSKNHAYEDGGAMDAFSLTKNKIHLTITNCIFDSNSAYKGAGAIWMGVKTVFTMKNDQFIKNQASIGGALFSEDGVAKITSCIFKSNKAAKITSWTVKTKAGGVLKHCGGAMMIQNKNIKIFKSTFKNNKATWGGALFFKAGKFTFNGNKLSSNKAKGGSALYSAKSIKISNKNKWGSKSTTKKALKVKNLISNTVKAK
ncbi:right-handed parallel beta-helix repeat-containing protein [Methanobrevibacter sp.]